MPIQTPQLKVTDDLRTLEDREEALVIDLIEQPAEREESAPPEVWLG